MGTDEAKTGRLKEEVYCLVKYSQSRLFFLGNFEVGEERGGVTGALLEIRRGGSDGGMELERKPKGLFDGGFLESRRDGLGNDEDGGLGFWEEDGVVLVDVHLISMEGGNGLHPFRKVVPSGRTTQPASLHKAFKTSLLSQCLGKL